MTELEWRKIRENTKVEGKNDKWSSRIQKCKGPKVDIKKDVNRGNTQEEIITKDAENEKDN